MNIDGDLHAALMARVELLTGYEIMWPQRGGDIPSGEYIAVSHLPNDTRRPFLQNNAPKIHKGFLVLILSSDLGQHEAITRQKATQIADHFPDGLQLTSNDATVEIINVSIKSGSQTNTRWDTPIWVEYHCLS